MESFIELLAFIGADIVEDRFGTLVASLYVLIVVSVGIAAVFALAIWVPSLVN